MFYFRFQAARFIPAFLRLSESTRGTLFPVDRNFRIHRRDSIGLVGLIAADSVNRAAPSPRRKQTGEGLGRGRASFRVTAYRRARRIVRALERVNTAMPRSTVALPLGLRIVTRDASMPSAEAARIIQNYPEIDRFGLIGRAHAHFPVFLARNARHVDLLTEHFFLSLSPSVQSQILDVDREGLTKLKKAVKALHASGNGKHSSHLIHENETPPLRLGGKSLFFCLSPGTMFDRAARSPVHYSTLSGRGAGLYPVKFRMPRERGASLFSFFRGPFFFLCDRAH